MVKIAILGYGVVGSGIVQVLNLNRFHIEKKAGCAFAVKYVLDKRDVSSELNSLGTGSSDTASSDRGSSDTASSDRESSDTGDSNTEASKILYTNDIETIISDKEVKIVAEVMGGVNPAYDFVKRALKSGKHVCTSNKELVISHGAELLALAKELNLNFMFEASVGGGIPVVRPINMALTPDEIVAVSGILNGTSNYMLTQMSNFGKSYDEALKEAQDLGYAEKDPTADVGGFDAARKLAILLSLSTGRQVDYEEILTEGITNIKQADFAFARAFGFSLKPMADGRLSQGGVSALSAPMLVHHSEPIFAVSGVYNGVIVQAKATGNCMFYGQGAGQYPTAGAVISDIVDISKHLHRHVSFSWSTDKNTVLPYSSYVTRKMVRISYNDSDDIKIKTNKKKIREIAGESPIKELPGYPGQAAWLTPKETEEETKAALENLKAAKGIKILGTLRVYEPVEDQL